MSRMTSNGIDINWHGLIVRPPSHVWLYIGKGQLSDIVIS